MVGRAVSWPSPPKNERHQMASFTAAAVAMYSASTVDSATVFCRALCQLMTPPASMKA